MNDPISILVSQMETRITSSLERIGDSEERAHVRGALIRLSAEVTKHHWAWMQARNSGNSYQENQHEMQLYRLEKQIDKLFWPPNRLDFDIDIGNR